MADLDRGKVNSTSTLIRGLRAAWDVAYEEMARLAIDRMHQDSLAPNRGEKRVVLVVHST